MSKSSAGLLLYRRVNGVLQVLLVHPGGPFWASKDFGAWSIPKGEFAPGEDPLEAAKREFPEETGCGAEGDYITLAPLMQPSGKVIHVWAGRLHDAPACLHHRSASGQRKPGSTSSPSNASFGPSSASLPSAR